MLIASVKSERYKWINNLNDLPIIGSICIACAAMLPMFLIQEIVQFIIGRSEVFDLSVTFFLNNLIFHLFLIYAFKIKIRLFFIPSTLFCFICILINGYDEYDKLANLIL